MLAALAGLFGPGPLSHSGVASADGDLRVDYLRFARAGGTMQLDVDVDGDLARSGEVTVVLDRAYLETVEVDHITPAPTDEVARGGGVGYVFAVEPSTSSVTATFSLRPVQMGWTRTRLAVPGGPALQFSQLFYP